MVFGVLVLLVASEPKNIATRNLDAHAVDIIFGEWFEEWFEKILN